MRADGLVMAVLLVCMVSGEIPNCVIANSDVNIRTNSAVLNCTINDEKTHWNFSLVRNWAQENNCSAVDVYITCVEGAGIVLRRPLKARNLRTLHIHGCHINGEYDLEFSKELDEMEFTIRRYILDNCAYITRFSELYKFAVENYQKMMDMYWCEFPLSLQNYTRRNVPATKLIHDLDTDDENRTIQGLKQYLRDRRQCTYSHMQYLEISGSKKSKNNLASEILHRINYPHLNVLNLSSLLLTKTPSDLYKNVWRSNFPELEHIDLSHNQLTSIDFEKPGKKPLIVNLSYNAIFIVTQSDLAKLQSSYPGLVVNIRNNPFVCNCSQQDFVSFLKEEYGDWIGQYAYLQHAKCSGPLSKKWQYLKDQKDLCKVDLIKLLYVSLPLLTVCFVVLLVLVRFRREIRVVVSTRITSRFRSNQTTCFREKDFDAFVSYSSMDEKWVYDILCRRLENTVYGFKLCLHHKHFVPGAYILDNIIDSVERSRHTLMILSPNFLESEWCILEFRKAFHQGLVEKNRHLIVVMLDGLDNVSLQPDIKHFLQTYTYLKVSELLFWDKLVYALADRHPDKRHKTDCPSSNGRVTDEHVSDALITQTVL